MSEQLDQLKQEADELGLKYSPNIGEAKLQEKIDEYYKAQETSFKEVDAAIKNNEAKENSEAKTGKTKKAGKTSMTILAKKLYDKARRTKVVTIIDNDQRVNNQTTTCKANWTNNYYDMGTRIFPLNTPIEIPQGFIDVLKEVWIPHHVHDPKTQLSKTIMRRRYTIQVEDFKPVQED